MKTLTIKDLSRTEQLDRAALSGVRGGWKMGGPSYSYGDISYAPTYDSSITAAQNLTQFQSVVNATANGSAFLEGVSATNQTSQNGQNNIFGGGAV